MSLSISLAALVTISGLIATWQKITRTAKRDREKAREEHEAKILQAAKEEDAALKAKVDARIERLEDRLENLQHDMEKDISHLKETYSAEIKVLGEKIEALRDELRNQHSQMVTLLSKLIESKD